MTQDALIQGKLLQGQIMEKINILNKHLNAVADHMKELGADEQAAITSALQGIHRPKITALQTELINLTADYTASTPSTKQS